MFGFSGNVNVNVPGLNNIGGDIGGAFGLGGFGGGGQNNNNRNNNQQNSYEMKIREQYETKITTYEVKIKEQITTIQKYEQAFRTYDQKLKEKDDEINRLKIEFKNNYDLLLRDRNNLQREKDQIGPQMDSLRKENFGLKQSVSSYELNITSLTDKIRFFENENNLKLERMREMESKLIAASNQINESLNLDVNQEEQLRKHRDLIASLTNQLERMKIEDAAEDIKFAEMEAKISSNNLEISNLKKHIEELNDKLLLAENGTNVETSEIYLQLEGRYNDVVVERDQLSAQINLKINTIKDLENRISNLNQKMSNLTRNIEELKFTIESLESQQLDLKRLLSDYEIKLNTLLKESSQKDNKIASFENVIKSKDSKITQLTELVKTRDLKIGEYEKKIQEGNSAVTDLRDQLEKRLKEISEWKAEDERDNAQIASLLKTMEEQNLTIKKWEEENERDDAQIAELQKQVQEKNEAITKLKEFIFQFRNKFLNVRNSAFSLEIVDQSVIQEKVSAFTTEITQSEKYKSLELNVTLKDQEIDRLRQEMNHYREEVTSAYNEKNNILVQLESLRSELEAQKQVIVNNNLRFGEYEAKINQYSQKVETESTTTIVAHSRVDSFKSSVQAASEEVEALFKDIETILA